MRKAADKWPQMLKLVEKCKKRSDGAYDKIVMPLLEKEMAWVQTFVGIKGGRLTPLLDKIVDEKTKVSKRQRDIYRSIGRNYLNFLERFSNYLKGLRNLIIKSDRSVADSTYYNGEELIEKLKVMKKDFNDLAEFEVKVKESVSVLDNILEEVKKRESDLENALTPDDLKNAGVGLGESAVENVIDGIKLKKEVLSKFYWEQISEWIKKWQYGLKNEKAYIASLY